MLGLAFVLKVFITTDVELWCGGWTDLDNRFPKAFETYIHGRTPRGDFGLPFQVCLLQEHGLTGVFFVEPLFSLRFGIEPLTEIVDILTQAKQTIDLHMHPEWVDEAIEPPLPGITGKRPHMRDYSRDEQYQLIRIGSDLLKQAGAPPVHAFRAGGFGFDIHTLSALKDNGILVDSSYNPAIMGMTSGLRPNEMLTQPLFHEGVCEVPMTVFTDRPGHLRQAQLCACSSREIEGMLWKSLEEGREAAVILSHSVELLDGTRTRPNKTVIKRFKKLCEFLDRNRDVFEVTDFSEYDCPNHLPQPAPITSPIWKTGIRHIEQAWSRISAAG